MSMKQCCGCRETKPLAQFHNLKRTHDGKDSRCRACRAVEQKAKVERLTREQYLKALERNRSRIDRRYQEKLKKQGGVCAICGDPPIEGQKRFAQDHDHLTGQNRDLLCQSCNYGLGCFKDDPERLQAAMRYLKRHARKRRISA